MVKQSKKEATMNKNTIIAILVALVGLMAITLLVVDSRKGDGSIPKPPPSDAGTKTPPSANQENPPKETEISAVKQEDVEGLPRNSQEMKGLIEITGRGARAKNGYEVSCDFYYVTEVFYKSHVKERSVTPAGEVRVVEARRYEQCNDQITIGDFDVKVALDTLPMRQVQAYVSTVAEFVGGFFGAPPGAGTSVVATCVEGLGAIDGVSVKQTMSLLTGLFGEDMPKDIKKLPEALGGSDVQNIADNIKNAVQEVSGKEYIVTYYQSKQGEPLRVSFKRADKSPLTMQEYKILREMNVFLCCNVIPSRGPAIGETWDVEVGNLPCVFDSLSGGNKVKGTLKAKRLPDEPDGLWNVDLGGGRVAVLNENGMESGSFMIKNGCALADPSGKELRAFQMLGLGKLRVEEAKKRFIVLDFLERIDGDCEVRMTLSSGDAK